MTINQEEVCIWFKDLEGHARIQLMCSLLDSCLPLELRFLGTYLEYAAGKHYTHLQKWEKDANNNNSLSATDLSDTKTRRKMCIYLALLHSHNRSMAMKLFNILSHFDFIENTFSNQTNDDNQVQDDALENDSLSSKNEIKLLLTMASLQPAFDFRQRELLRTKLSHFISNSSQELLDSIETSIEASVLTVTTVTSTHSTDHEGHMSKQPLLPSPPIPYQGGMHYSAIDSFRYTIPIPANFQSHPLPGNMLIQRPPIVLNQPKPGTHSNLVTMSPITNNSKQFILSPVLPQHKQNIVGVNQFPVSSSAQDLSSLTPDANLDSFRKATNNIIQNNNATQILQNNNEPYLHKDLNFPVLSNATNRSVYNTTYTVDVSVKHHNNASKYHTASTTISLNNVPPELKSLQSGNDHVLFHRSYSESNSLEKSKENTLNNEAASYYHRTPFVNEFHVNSSRPLNMVGRPYVHNLARVNMDDSIISQGPSLYPRVLHDLNNLTSSHSNTNLSSMHLQNVQYSNVQPVNSPFIGMVYTKSSVSKYSSSEGKQTVPTTANNGYIQHPILIPEFVNVPSPTLSRTNDVKVDFSHSSQQHLDIGSYNKRSKSLPIPVQTHMKSITTNHSEQASSKFSSESFDSSCYSPSTSPRPSPFPSPCQSPMVQRKSYSKEAYTSATNWLKSLRLHKYSDKFERYTFQMMKELDDDDLDKLGLTLGARTKFKQNIDLLIKRGFVEFGVDSTFLINESLPLPSNQMSLQDGSPDSKHKSTTETSSISSDLSSGSSSPISNPTLEVAESLISPYQISNITTKKECKKKSPSTDVHTTNSISYVHQVSKKNNMLLDSCIVDNCLADDEVFANQRKPEEHLPTCYNCGYRGHYGDECTEQTMEAQTYSRYAFHLDFSPASVDITSDETSLINVTSESR